MNSTMFEDSISDCPFCRRLADNSRDQSDNPVVAIPDAFPVTRGHTLLIPRRHVNSVFDLDEGEYDSLWAKAREVRQKLLKEIAPDGFNIGINDGESAGQTIPHAHVHIIPRWKGDSPDPRGGIRWVLPDAAPYWEDVS